MAGDWEDAPDAKWEDAPLGTDTGAAMAGADPAAGEAAVDLVRTVGAGAAGAAYGGLAMGGRALANIPSLVTGGKVGSYADPMESYRAAAASVPGQQPHTQAVKDTLAAVGAPGRAAESAIEHGEDVIDPSGNLKATASDIAERGNAVTALAQAVPGVAAAASVPGRVMRTAREGLAARDAVRTSTAAAAAAEQAPVKAAQAHLDALQVPVNGVPIEGAPGRTRPATGTELSEGYDRAVLHHVGVAPEDMPAGTTARDALPNAKENITKENGLDGIASRTHTQFDTELAGDIKRIRESVPLRVPANDQPQVHAHINEILKSAAQNDSHLPGEVMQKLHTNLGELESNPGTKNVAGQLREALHDALARHAAPEDVARLGELRQQYRNLSQVERSLDPVTGHVDPNKLTQQLNQPRNKNQALYGKGDQDLLDTARAGSRVLPGMQKALQGAAPATLGAKIRNVVARAGTDLAMTGGGALAGGPIGALAGAAAEGAVGPALRAGITRVLGGSAEEAAAARGTAPTLGARIAGGRMRGGPGGKTGPSLLERIRNARAPVHENPVPPKSDIEHTHDPDSGEHVVKSPNGETYARDQGNDIRVERSDTREGAEGKGEATRREAQLADTAHARGGILRSDTSVSSGKRGKDRVYSNLARMGYDVKKNPGATKSETTGNWVSDDPRNPIFTVGPKRKPTAEESYRKQLEAGPQQGRDWHDDRGMYKAPNESPPLGQRIGGGKQRGGPKFVPKDEPAAEPATVNIGLHQGTEGQPGFRKMSKQEAVKALKSQGLDVGKTSVHTPEGGEPTLVADIHRPMSDDEGHAVASQLKQQSIAQRNPDGTGSMHGPGLMHEEAIAQGWDKYNSDQFQMHDGRPATMHDAENADYKQVQPHKRAAPAAPASEASKAAAENLKPALAAEGERLEQARLARLANRKARVGNVRVPF